MTIKQAIEKAIIDGGYFRGSSFDHDRDEDDTIERDKYQILLDPLFWKSLGKAMGWKGEGTSGMENYYILKAGHQPWGWKWHRFIDHLAEGKDAESFFKDL